MSSTPVFAYRNKHTGSIVRIIGSPMLADALYAHTSPYLDVDQPDVTTYRMVFGMPGRDGTTFDPEHWAAIAEKPLVSF